MYTAIILFTISDDDLRDEFTKELKKQGFEKHPDQSTYSYPMTKVGQIFRIDAFSKWINSWGKGKQWEVSDFISIYYLDSITQGSNYSTIRNKTYTSQK